MEGAGAARGCARTAPRECPAPARAPAAPADTAGGAPRPPRLGAGRAPRSAAPWSGPGPLARAMYGVLAGVLLLASTGVSATSVGLTPVDLSGKMMVGWGTGGGKLTLSAKAPIADADWLAVGLASTTARRMQFADLYVCFLKDGYLHQCHDAYTQAETGKPLLDTDLSDGVASINSFDMDSDETYISMTLERDFDTGDSFDHRVEQGEARLLWAFGKGDTWDAMQKHATGDSGSVVVDLLAGTMQKKTYAALDAHGVFQLAWQVFGDEIAVTMRAPTEGWVGFGVHDSADIGVPGMEDADMVICHVDDAGAAACDDYKSTSHGTRPKLDTEQVDSGGVRGVDSLLSFGGGFHDGYSRFTWRRKLVTGDKLDHDMNQDAFVKVIWAIGQTGDRTRQHGPGETHGEAHVNFVTGEVKPGKPWHDLDLKGSAQLAWDIDGRTGTIEVAMRAETDGWLALGIYKNLEDRKMTNLDVYRAYSQGGFSSGFQDCWSERSGVSPEGDATLSGTNDILDGWSVVEAAGYTYATFRRKLATGDEYDALIDNKLARIAWAFSSSDDVRHPHGVGRSGEALVNWFANQVYVADHLQRLDDDGKFRLGWRIDHVEETIKLRMRVATTGWVGIGIAGPATASSVAADEGVDWIRCSVAAHLVTCVDQYASTNGLQPSLDSNLGGRTNLLLYDGEERGGYTEFNVTRRLVTGDAFDRALKTGDVLVKWAYAETDSLETAPPADSMGEAIVNFYDQRVISHTGVDLSVTTSGGGDGMSDKEVLILTIIVAVLASSIVGAIVGLYVWKLRKKGMTLKLFVPRSLQGSMRFQAFTDNDTYNNDFDDLAKVELEEVDERAYVANAPARTPVVQVSQPPEPDPYPKAGGSVFDRLRPKKPDAGGDGLAAAEAGVEHTPVEHTPVEHTPVEHTPVEHTPVEEP